MTQLTPPVEFVESLKTFITKSAKSTPDLSAQATKLLTILDPGQETEENAAGIAEFRKAIERLNLWVDRVNIDDITQLSRVTNLKGSINFLVKDLKREGNSESSTYPLSFFANTSRGSPFDQFIIQFKEETNALEVIAAPPELQPQATFAMNFDFSGCRIDGMGTGVIGCNNAGAQVHSYAGSTISTSGSFASGNHSLIEDRK